MRFNVRSLIWNTGMDDPSPLRLFMLSGLSEEQLQRIGSSPMHPFRQCKLAFRLKLKTVFNLNFHAVFFSHNIFTIS